MRTSIEGNIRACLLKNGAHCEEEDAAADGRSCERHQFDGIALYRQRGGASSKETQVWSKNVMRKAFRSVVCEMKLA